MGQSTYLDIEEYASCYNGHTKIMRLLCIAEHCGGGEYVEDKDAMELGALRIAYEESKKGFDTRLFREVAEKINGRLGASYGCDNDWCEKADRDAMEGKENFERFAKAHEKGFSYFYASSCEKCGDFFYSSCGELENALVWYRKAITDTYPRPVPDILRVHMKAILALVMQKEFGSAEQLVQRVYEVYAEYPIGQDLLFKLNCARAVCSLGSRNYGSAADQFLALFEMFDLDNPYKDLVIHEDVATYGSLCALASFDRSRLESEFDEKIKVCEVTPPDVREVVRAFIVRRYIVCMDHFSLMRPRLMLDLYMHEHVDALYALIQEKCLMEFAAACSTIDLQHAANTFRMSVSRVEQKLNSLISRNLLVGRIDKKEGVFYKHRVDRQTLQGLEEVVTDLQDGVQEVLTSIHNYDIVVV